MKNPIKKPKKSQKSIYLKEDNWRKVEAKAIKDKRSTNFIMDELVEKSLI